LIFIFLTSPIYSIGTTFLNVPFAPKHLALSGAGTALLGDPSLFRLNPALVVKDNPVSEVYFSYNSWLAGIVGHSVLAVQPFRGGSIALGFRSLSINDLELRTSKPTDNPIANFASSGISLEAGWGKKLGLVQFGGTFRLIRMESFIYSSSGLGLDGGITYSFNRNKIVTGIAFRNVGIMKKFNKVVPKMPTILSLGIVISSFPKIKSIDFLSTISIDNSELYGTVFRLGGEFTWEDLIIWTGTHSSKELQSFSGGVGFRSRILTISYGFQLASNNLGIPHILQIDFDLP
tara:strand:- start:29875 stop:30744 length:870 start_codon:yes stop_codon:yes gene_type:complete